MDVQDLDVMLLMLIPITYQLILYSLYHRLLSTYS